MNKRFFKILFVVVIMSVLLVGCSNVHSDSDNDSENLSELSSENMEVDYTVNEDGTYTCEGNIYDYKLTLYGKGNGSDKTSKFIVLTNNKDISFDDVFESLISSTLEEREPEYILLGLE